MPAALPILIAAAAGGVSAALAGTAILTGALIGGGLAALSSLLAPKPPKFNTPQFRPDTRGTVVEGVEGARWVVGRARTGGSLKFYEETNDGRDVWMGIALSEGACGFIERIFINEQEVGFTRTGNQLAIGVSADGETDYSDKAFIYEYFDGDGTEGDEIRTACTEFTADHTFMGLAWMAVHLHQPGYDMPDGRFWSQRPQIQVVMRGMLLTWPGETTPTWTENAAAVRYWVERERAGLPAVAIDGTAFAAAHALCDEDVTTTLPSNLAGYTATGLRYRANGVITDDMALDDIRSEIDWCWQGWAVESGGIMYFRPGVDRTATASVGEDDIISVDAVRPAPALQDRVNALSMQLQSSLDHDYLPYDVPEVEDTPALTRDDNYYLPQHTGERLFVNGPVDAARLIAIGLRRNRASMTLRVTLKPGLMLERFSIIPSDIVTMTLPEYGFSNFLFMVTSISVNEDFSVSLLLDEERRGAYADTLELPPVMARDIDIPRPRQVPDVEGIASDEISSVQKDGSLLVFLAVSWDESVAPSTQVQIRVQTETATIGGESKTTEYREPNVTVGTTYEFRARHLSLFGHAGEFTAWMENTIDGDLMPPEDIAGFAVEPVFGGYRATWTPATANDYKHTEIWQGAQGSAFVNAAMVATIAGSSYERSDIPDTTALTIWARHIDRSLNEGGRSSEDVTTAEAIAGSGGEDGLGVEYIFAVTTSPTIPANQRPLNTWGFDDPQTRNGLAWTDGASISNLSSSTPYLWRAERQVPGSPGEGAVVSDTWSGPIIVSRYGSDGDDGTDGVLGADGTDGTERLERLAMTALGLSGYSHAQHQRVSRRTNARSTLGALTILKRATDLHGPMRRPA